jgi:hypothetical protein
VRSQSRRPNPCRQPEWWAFTAHHGSSTVFWQSLMASINGLGPALWAIYTPLIQRNQIQHFLTPKIFASHLTDLSVGAPACTQPPTIQRNMVEHNRWTPDKINSDQVNSFTKNLKDPFITNLKFEGTIYYLNFFKNYLLQT